MQKDFDAWNILKKKLEFKNPVFCNVREIWWCSVGVNVGTETSGKSELSERPVLVIRVYNKDSIVIVPLTSKEKDDMYHMKINYGENHSGWLILSHSKTINSRRLQRKMDYIDESQYLMVLKNLCKILINENRL